MSRREVRMRMIGVLSVLFWLPLAGLQQEQRFEGTVTVVTAFQSDAHANLLATKKWPRERLDITSSKYPKVAIIYDLRSGTRTVLLPDRKEYWREYIAQHATALRAAVEDPGYAPGPTGLVVTPTNRTETIAGYECRYSIVGAAQMVDICAAKGMGQFIADKQIDGARALLATSNTDTAYDDLGSRFPGGYFPLKIVSRARGAPRTVWEVTSIKRTSVPDQALDVPSDYTQIQPPE